VRDTLVPQGFGRDGVVYINLDAFWSTLDAVQLASVVADVKTMHGANGVHFEPGIYWTPFAYWSDDLDAYVEGTGMKYRYRDILLKAPDGSFLPKVDGGRPIDPSHPGAKARTAYFMRQFKQLGFMYLKLDFLSHGALEGAHFDPEIQTGIQAYNLGMKQIVDENANRMFLSLSIAPLFPSGYGHSRRLSCDSKGHIGGGDQSTEYMLNSLTYGWWTDKSLGGHRKSGHMRSLQNRP
jgi:alpha-galactosidase